MFSQFHINYNDLPEVYKKGTALIRVLRAEAPRKAKPKAETVTATEAQKELAKSVPEEEKKKSSPAEEKKEKEKAKETKPEEGKKEALPAVPEAKTKQILNVNENMFAEEFWTKHDLKAKLN